MSEPCLDRDVDRFYGIKRELDIPRCEECGATLSAEDEDFFLCGRCAAENEEIEYAVNTARNEDYQ